MSNKTEIDPEDRRKHLDFIQATITRMSAASTTTKSWMMPVVTATYGYALTQNANSIAWLGVGATVLFAYLDANYLRAEHRFRRLYDAVAEGDLKVAAYSLNFTPFEAAVNSNRKNSKIRSWISKYLPGARVWASWAIGPFYLALVGVGVFIAFWTA